MCFILKIRECNFIVQWSPFFRKNTCFWKFLKLRSFALLVRAACRWRWVQSTGGETLTGRNWSTRIKTFPRATSSTKIRTNGLGLNLGLHGERPTVNLLRHITAVYLTLHCVGHKYSVHTPQKNKVYQFKISHLVNAGEENTDGWENPAKKKGTLCG